MPGLLAEKLGMTQIFSSEGVLIPVTVLQVKPCRVIMKKTKDTDGYQALQVGAIETDARKVNKPHAGHFVKKNQKVHRVLKEFRTDTVDPYDVGDVLDIRLLQVGDVVNLQGTSKGKGFQGVIKRHHFAGMHATHGCSLSHRMPGSIGQRTYPGKVFKGKRMAGRMGGESVTVKHLTVVGVESEQSLLLIRGAVPGANHSLLTLRSGTVDLQKRFIEAKKKESIPEEKKQ